MRQKGIRDLSGSDSTCLSLCVRELDPGHAQGVGEVRSTRIPVVMNNERAFLGDVRTF